MTKMLMFAAVSKHLETVARTPEVYASKPNHFIGRTSKHAFKSRSYYINCKNVNHSLTVGCLHLPVKLEFTTQPQH